MATMERVPPAIAAVATPCGRDVGAGLDAIERAVVAARGQGARLVVFPECAIGGYLREPMPGEHGPEHDKLFPEGARALALDGAEIVASLAAWPVCRQRPAATIDADRQTRHFNLTDEARAVENQVVWVSANQTGTLGPLTFLGHAKVVDPDGVVLAATGSAPGVAVAQLDAAAAVAAARMGIDHLADRRPLAYGGPAHVEAVSV